MPHQNLPPGVIRDPATGQFVDVDDIFDDVEIESVNFGTVWDLDAADLDGTAGSDLPEQGNWEGEEVLDYDDIIDRHEVAVLLGGQHTAEMYSPSTQTADGTARFAAEISTSPARSVVVTGSSATTAVDEPSGGETVERTIVTEDSVDIVGRPLMAATYSPFTDGAAGLGGAGSIGRDWYDLVEYARFVGLAADRRDELFCNGLLEASNIDDGGIVAQLQGVHYYAVGEELV